MTTEDKALSLVLPIKEAHEKAIAAQQSGYAQSLEAAIIAGELLEKAKEAVGPGGWSKWREKHLNDIPQTIRIMPYSPLYVCIYVIGSRTLCGLCGL